MNPVYLILLVAAVLITLVVLLRVFRVINTVACLALAVVLFLLGGLVAIKVSQIKVMMSAKWAFPPTPVTTAAATEQDWAPLLPAVGSVAAVQGVMVSAQLDGNVTQIAFTAGGAVKAGDLLIQQDVSSEQAQLAAAQAAAELARINRERSRGLLAKVAISQQQFDSDDATYKQAVAQAANIQATIDKKTIRAPFAGRLGVRLVNLGQTLKAGDGIVSLQSLSPVYADFYLPQHAAVGTITAINPDVDNATRNVRVEATVANADERLRPGMFVNAAVILPEKRKALVIPATSVLYAPYGDSVFVVERHAAADGTAATVVRQQFVRLGEKRGDFVAVASGLKPGEVVVTTGAFKLRNGAPVTIDNTLAPDAQLAPEPDDS